MEFLTLFLFISIIILAIVIILICVLVKKSYVPTINIVIVTNIPKDPRLKLLKQSLYKADFNHRDIFVLSTPEKFTWNERLLAWKKFYKTLDPDAIVLSLDAFDVIVLGSKEEIFSKFQSLNCKAVFGCVNYCWPLECEICKNKTTHSKRWNPHTQNYSYLCAGTYMGRAGFLSNLLEKNPWSEDVDDQCYFATLFEKQDNHTDMILDFKNLIFQSTTSVYYNAGILKHSRNDKQRLFHSELNTEPSIFHFDTIHYPYNDLKACYDLMTQKFS